MHFCDMLCIYIERVLALEGKDYKNWNSLLELLIMNPYQNHRLNNSHQQSLQKTVQEIVFGLPVYTYGCFQK